MDNINDRYVGPKKVKLTQVVGQNRNGVDLIQVTYDDNTSETYSSLMLSSEGIVTNGGVDASQFRLNRLYPVVSAILKTINDYNIYLDEITFLTQLIITSFNENLDKADQRLWNVPDLNKRTVSQVDAVLQSAEKGVTVNDVISPDSN